LDQSVPAIETHGLTKYYGEARGVVDLDLRVEQGEIFGFLGPNGAGKTTTIRLLMDFLRPTSGAAEMLGLDVRQHSFALRHRVSNLPGEFSIYPRITGRQFLDLCGSGHADGRALEKDIVERLDVDLDRRVSSLSPGNRQKIGLVQAFMADPELLILDEPTTGLDPLVQQELYAILQEQRARGKTVFMSSHNLAEVERVCDRIGVVRDGRLVAVETVDDLQTRRVRKMEITFTRATDIDSLVIPGVTVESSSERGVILLVTGGVGELLARLARLPVEDLVFPEASIEDTFMSFYTEGEE
jgi:ABC-2 type transport system ATP-binding protein